MQAEALRILKLLREAFPPQAPAFLPLVRQGTFRDEEAEGVEKAFLDKDYWADLSSDFLDAAPDGFASAAAFFNDGAISFYLPAYLSADLRGELARVTPVGWLTDGLDGTHRSTHAKDGRATPQEEATRRWRLLSPEQCGAVAAYLRFRQQQAASPEKIETALQSFWMLRAQG